MEEVFTQIYEKELWGKGKGSGTGSSPSYCRKYMDYIQRDIDADHFDATIDLGSGDWQFSNQLDWRNMPAYLGIEIVTPVFNKVQSRYSDFDSHIQFLNEDFSNPLILDRILQGYATKQKLILIKDVFQHWEDNKIRQALAVIYANCTKGDSVVISNNWRYIRKLHPIPDPRILDRYHWCPVDFTTGDWKKWKLEPVLYYPRKEKMVVRRDF